MTGQDVGNGRSVGAHCLLFVYGTLRQGGRNHHWLAESEGLGPCLTAARFKFIDVGAFPGAIEGGTQAIKGEVYRVSTRVLVGLDRLEGCPDFFKRIELNTVYGPAWIYVFLHANGSEQLIASGDWLAI